jgi:hypothetical protein
MLARAYNIQLLSDAYDRAPRLPGEPTSEAVTLGARLRQWAGATHQWDRQGTLVRLRSQTWFFDRPREVPSRLLRRWQKQCDRQGALPLEEWVTHVAGLSDGQLETLAAIAGELGLPPEFQTAPAAAAALRLYASLPPEQQQALARGEAIATKSMTPRQRALFLAAAGQPAATEARRGNGSPIFSLTRTPFVRLRERRGESVRYHLEPVTASAVPKRAAAGESSLSRLPVMQVTLQCRLGAGISRSVPVVTTRLPAPGAGSQHTSRKSSPLFRTQAGLLSWKGNKG